MFETLEDTRLRSELNTIELHTWGNRDCCIPHGATHADLVEDLSDYLSPGDFLLFEEVRSPETGLTQDADPAHRAVVRIVDVEHITRDRLLDVELTRVTWNERDALRFPLCLASAAAGEAPVSVARGNIVLADHGQTVSETYPPVSDSGPTTIVARPSYRFPLRRGPVSGRIAPREERGLPASATSILADEGHDVEPQVDLQVHTLGDVLVDWHPVPNLLESQSMEHHFVVETEDDGRASVRFGSRGFGREPPDDSFIVTTYRVGVGRAGNIGAEALAHVIDPGNVTNWPVVDAVRNPMPAPAASTPSRASG